MRHAQADSTRQTGNAFLPGSIPASGVISGAPAGKSCQRAANHDTRAACASRQKSFMQGWISKNFQAFAQTRRAFSDIISATGSATKSHKKNGVYPGSADVRPQGECRISSTHFRASSRIFAAASICGNPVNLRLNSPFRSAVILFLCVFLLPAAWAQSPVPANKPAAYPAWWFQREVIKRTDPQNASPAWPGDYSPADDYSVINQGQLKNLAAKADAELLAELPPPVWTLPAGAALQTLVAGWSTSTTADNYATVNQGQLKTVAKKFYAVLAAAGYTAGLNLPPNGWTAGTYPWTDATADDDNYAAANTGQAKRLFSFDPASLPDTDQDGIRDIFESASGTDPLLFSSGNNGTSDGWWISYGLDPFSSSIQDTDGDGRSDAKEFLDGTNPLQADTNPHAGLGAPLAPSNLSLGTLENGHNTLTWVNNSSATGAIVERTGDGVNWQTVGVIPGTQATFTDATAQPDTVYFYRVVAFN